jgi:AhpD family alkylhydroperoxidase
MTAPALTLSSLRSLGRAARNADALLGRRIGARLRELVILHVSSVNGCPVCSAAHGLIGRASGLDRADVRAARGCEPAAGFDERTRAALRYAELRTRDQEGDDPRALEALAALFTPEERRELRAVVDLFTFNNRFNNTWERVVPGAAARRARLGLCAE